MSQEDANEMIQILLHFWLQKINYIVLNNCACIDSITYCILLLLQFARAGSTVKCAYFTVPCYICPLKQI